MANNGHAKIGVLKILTNVKNKGIGTDLLK